MSEHFQNLAKGELNKRSQTLQTQLRLAQIKEGEDAIRKICNEYMDVFKLPGDRITTPSAIQRHIPTLIPNNHVITLRNYRLPKQHQKVKNQVQQMLEDGIVHQSQSHWNFPILVVPKKLNSAGKRKWHICVDFR